MKKQTILVDATNIKSGGGLVHLKSILNSNIFINSKYNIHVLGSKKTLKTLNNIYIKKNSWFFEQSFIFQFIWKLLFLKFYLFKHNFDLIFVPGGWFLFKYRFKVIILSQNFILFNQDIIDQYKYSFQYIKFIILKYLHFRSINKSDGVIYLSKYVLDFVNNIKNIQNNNHIVISHGANEDFNFTERNLDSIDLKKEINLVYSSHVDYYKKQNNIIDEVIYLNHQGYKINLNLVGTYNKKYLKVIKNKISKYEFINFLYYLDHVELIELFKKMNVAVFASTCENLPITLIEYMKSNIPIICNKIQPCVEVLQNGSVYFDINKKYDFADNLLKLLNDINLQKKITKISYNNSRKYNWDFCAINTFKFLENSIDKS